MSRYLKSALAAGTAITIVTLAGRASSAGTATAPLQVSITVTNNCSVSTSGVQFNTYDPSASNVSAPATATGIVTIACTQGSTPVIGLSSGRHHNGSVRRASDGANSIAYQLYKDSGHTEPWGDAGSDVLNAGPTSSRQPRSFTVHGIVPAGQNVPTGTYSDTIVVSVNF